MYIKPNETYETETAEEISVPANNMPSYNVKIEITEQGQEGIFIKDEPESDMDYTDSQVIDELSTEPEKNELNRYVNINY